jgi:hypothetical protein
LGGGVYSVSKVCEVQRLYSTTGPLLSKNITYKSFLIDSILLAMQGRIAFLVAEKFTYVSSPVTKLPKTFLLYFKYFFNKSLAFQLGTSFSRQLINVVST